MPRTSKGDGSIQAYFHSSPRPLHHRQLPSNPSTAGLVGDGFTQDEVHRALKPPADNWKPRRPYDTCTMAELRPGTSKAVTFSCRVVNMYNGTSWTASTKAKGFLKLCVKDDTGFATVKLWYSNVPPAVRLGSLMTVWTTSVTTSDASVLSSTTMLHPCVSIFERDSSSHFKVHVGREDDHALYTTPADSFSKCSSNGLMTLCNYIEGGSEVPEARILVVVRGVGARKKVITGKGVPTETVNVTVHDDTCEATLSLWGACALSPFSQAETDTEEGWKPGKTCLLIRGPNIKAHAKVYLTLNATSTLEVDPNMDDADWLREWAARKMSREDVNPGVPAGMFDLELFMQASVRCLYSIAELDEQAREARASGATVMGILSVVLLESKLHECWRRNMLYSGQCCGMVMHSNQLTEQCKGCEKGQRLRLNPHVVGRMADETGLVESGKLVFSDKAWLELLGRRPGDMAKLHPASIKYISDRILFSRLTLVFGWTGEGPTKGRICVLEVRS